MVYFGCHQVNPYVQTVQNMYGKGGERVGKAELRPPEVDPYFKRKKITLGGVTKNQPATILIVDRNPPERIFCEFYGLMQICALCWDIQICTYFF